MSFKLEFDTENAEFNGHILIAVPHVLKEVAQKIAFGMCKGNVRDFNGNTIGQWHLEHQELVDDE